jgi:hypothetical protein
MVIKMAKIGLFSAFIIKVKQSKTTGCHTIVPSNIPL